VADNNKLEYANDFNNGLDKILLPSRVITAWGMAGCIAGSYETALAYAMKRKSFGRPIAKFQLTQEKLSRMLALSELCTSHCIMLTQRVDKGECTMGQASRLKAIVSRLAREAVALGREIVGGNGILI
jgi:alkylation response protein AidB-like acyl-CoA dehydrogenase